MKKIRIILLVLAMGLFALNFWTVDMDHPFSGTSIWAYVRILAALMLVLVLAVMIRRDMKGRA